MWEVLKFLWTCPNVVKHEHRYRYKNIGEVQTNVLESIATNQYILFRDEAGHIEHFLCYWKVLADDLQDIQDGLKPAIRWGGDKMYICEHGNKGGRKSLTLMIQEIKKRSTGQKGVMWRNWNRGETKVFMDKKGVTN
jgi:hemolysin-activating ACP:hemolysin acyltransferase